jgi:hypothetical protein
MHRLGALFSFSAPTRFAKRQARKFLLEISAVLLVFAAIAPRVEAQGAGIGNTTSTPVQGDGPDALSNRSTILPPVPVALSDWRATPRWQPELRLTLAAFILRP